ncbi:hypothetical protein [Ruminococcus flavefaciens]|uniref:hypothetical protein n=1 Tax=Ruminococcus flavefaciens TaxID=1265 RepID=UPI0026EF3FD5|nr:hypothetical protein [Ruminococcus flavefaciens]
MKYVQKAQILSLRMQGVGYGTIAKEMCLTEDQVKLYCKTNGLAGDGSFVSENHEVWCRKKSRCLLCGKKVIQPTNGRPRRFCNGRCRTRYCRINKKIMEVQVNA